MTHKAIQHYTEFRDEVSLRDQDLSNEEDDLESKNDEDIEDES